MLLAVLCVLAAFFYGAATPMQLAFFLVPLPFLLIAFRRSRDHPANKWHLIAIGLFSLSAVLAAIQYFIPGPEFPSLRGVDLTALFDERRTTSFAVDRGEFFNKFGLVLLMAVAFIGGLSVGEDYANSVRFLKIIVMANAGLVILTFILFAIRPDLLLLSDRTAYLGNFTHGFVNRNTAATYLGIMSIISFALFVRRIRGVDIRRMFIDEKAIQLFWKLNFWQTTPYAFAMLVFLSGLMATASRGGIVASIIGLATFALTYIVKRRMLITGGILLATLTTIIIILLAQNEEMLASRFANVRSITNIERFHIYEATIAIAGDHPVLGIGLGGFASTFPQYRSNSMAPTSIVDRAHSTPLEIAAEMGIGFTLACALVWFAAGAVMARGVFRRTNRYIIPAAGFAIWTTTGAHMLVDFSLQIPGFALSFFAVLGLAISQSVTRGAD